MTQCPECRGGFVCVRCVASFPRVYIPPGPERVEALKLLKERGLWKPPNEEQNDGTTLERAD